MNYKQKKGFTLIELLVVISIISLLTSVVLAALSDAKKKANAAYFVSEMNQLRNAFEMYRTDNGKYPFEGSINGALGDDKSYQVITTSLTGVKGLNDELVNKKYISSIPKISQCPTACWLPSGPVGEDYGYITEPTTLAGADYKCGGVNFKSYLLYVGNNQISANYPQLDMYPKLYCIGQ